MRTGTWVAVAVAPLGLLVVLLARPAFDPDWENHPAHFWLVLGAAPVATALGLTVPTAARRPGDARLLLISVAFVASAGVPRPACARDASWCAPRAERRIRGLQTRTGPACSSPRRPSASWAHTPFSEAMSPIRVKGRRDPVTASRPPPAHRSTTRALAPGRRRYRGSSRRDAREDGLRDTHLEPRRCRIRSPTDVCRSADPIGVPPYTQDDERPRRRSPRTRSSDSRPGGHSSTWAASFAASSGAFRARSRTCFTDRCTQYAAAIAYRVLFSLFPLTIALVSIFGLVLQDDELRQDVIDELIDFLPCPSRARRTSRARSRGSRRRSPPSASSPRRAPLGRIRDDGVDPPRSGGGMKVERGRPAARAKLVDFVLVAAAGVLVSSSSASRRSAPSSASSSTASPSGRTSPRLRLPDPRRGPARRDRGHGAPALPLRPGRKLRRRGAIAGAILTAVGIWGSTKCSPIVFADFSRYNLIYGSLAGVMTFLFFVYVVAWILLLGAEFAYAWSQPPGPPGPPLRAQLIGV